MARLNPNFDEFCDPDNPCELSLSQATEAAERIKANVPVTPCIKSTYQQEFGMELYYKMESLHASGSVKERAAVNALLWLDEPEKKRGIVFSSIGNLALAVAYHAKRLHIPATVVLPLFASLRYQQRICAYGTRVLLFGATFFDAQRHARFVARQQNLTFIDGRDHPAVLAGYSTVALEILEQIPRVDAVLVPMGTGGLVAGITAVIKTMKPSCLVYGVSPENAAVFFKSLEADEPLLIPAGDTLAYNLAVDAIGVNSFHNVKSKLDKVLLVKEDWIARAILHLIERERYVVEGAGAIGLAALLGHLTPELKTKVVVCVLSGGNVDAPLLGRCLERGRAAEGRLIKFRVLLNCDDEARAALLQLLEIGRYNLVRLYKLRVSGGINNVEVAVVVEAMHMEHALELKLLLERAYGNTVTFDTEPFNDRRTCPCFIKSLKI